MFCLAFQVIVVVYAQGALNALLNSMQAAFWVIGLSCRLYPIIKTHTQPQESNGQLCTCQLRLM